MWGGESISIGCNCATDTDLLCICDKWLISKIMDREFRPKKRLILGPSAEAEARCCNIWNMGARVRGGISHREGYNLNAGQTAALWAYDVYPGCELHLWGFDSLWTGERTTQTDTEWKEWKSAKPPRDDGHRPAPQKWQDAWRVIHQKNPGILLYLHVPSGVKVNRLDGLFQPIEHE